MSHWKQKKVSKIKGLRSSTLKGALNTDRIRANISTILSGNMKGLPTLFLFCFARSSLIFSIALKSRRFSILLTSDSL